MPKFCLRCTHEVDFGFCLPLLIHCNFVRTRGIPLCALITMWPQAGVRLIQRTLLTMLANVFVYRQETKSSKWNKAAT